MSTSASADEPRRRKRLNVACNYCRSRKTRCDAQQPACRACADAGVQCVTNDRRRPHKAITRREAGLNSSSISGSVQSTGSPAVGDGDLSSIVHNGPLGDVRNDTKNESPKFSGALPIFRPSSTASAVDMLTEWLDLALHRLDIAQRFREPSTAVTTATSALQSPVGSNRLPGLAGLPDLPSSEACQALLDNFLGSLNVVLPIVDPQAARASVMLLATLGPASYSQSHDIASLVRAYLILATGAVSCGGGYGPPGAAMVAMAGWEPFVSDCLNLARQCLGVLVGSVSLAAAQALCLLSICLKHHADDVSAATAVVDLCVSIATAAGLRKARTRPWLAIYSYEKLFSFEIGRASSIHDTDDVDVEASTAVIAASADPSDVILSMILRLAVLLSDIGRQCVQLRVREERADSGKLLESAIVGKVQTTGDCGLRLMDWAETLPPAYRPTADLVCESETDKHKLAIAAFISVQYNTALLVLMRNSLLLSPDALSESSARIAKGKPWELVIRNGQVLVANAARRVVRLLTELEDLGQSPLLPIYAAPLHAIYILTVHTIRKPGARAARTDRELIQDAAHFVRADIGTNKMPSNDGKWARIDDTVTKVLSLTDKTATPERAPGGGSVAQDMTTSANMADPAANPAPAVGTASHLGAYYDPGTASLSEGLSWSPGLPDEIGCDWADFADFAAYV